MTRMGLPAMPDVKTMVYGNFRGVDFSVDPSQVASCRSPYAPNMISDDGGNPVKRLGWRVLKQFDGKINGLFRAKLAGTEHILVHAGSKLYSLRGGEAHELYSGIADSRSVALCMDSMGERSRVLDSQSETVEYPKSLELEQGKYTIEMTGGKGNDVLDRDDYSQKGGKGGKIIFDLTLSEKTNVMLKCLKNSTGHGESIHLLINDVLYAATGGGGDASELVYGNDNGLTYGSGGGAGGGKTGGDGSVLGKYALRAKGGTQTNGGAGGGYNGEPADSGYTIVRYTIGNAGGDYPNSVGGAALSGSEREATAGGCGYMGGGAGGVCFWKQKKNHETTEYWSYGSGAGGSSYLIEDDAVFKIEDSQGTNDGAAYIKIYRKADELQNLYLFTGNEVLVFDGSKVQDMAALAYVPTVIISRKPAGGGEVYEAVNLLTPKRTDSFLGDETSKSYQLTATNLDEDPVVVKVRNAEGDYDTLSEGDGFTVNRLTGKVTFQDVHPPIAPGQDNVLITFSKTVNGYADRVRNCTVCTSYGLGGNNRIFVSGNPDYPSCDYWSDIDRPTYFPDLNYAAIGTGNTAVIGYCKVGEYLAIVKEENQQDTTVFLRSCSLNSADEAVFSVKPEIAGIGAAAKYSFAMLGDEPLFLSRMGVYAVTSALLSYERTLRNRSHFVDRRLRAEKGLSDAVACEWNGYYLLAVNGNVYVLDGRHKAAEQNGNTDFVYECYFWTGVPVRCWLSFGEALYFGTEDGRVCCFNSGELPAAKMTVYSDGGTLSEDGRITGGRAIDTAWFTPNDDGGAIHLFKTLQKKGSLAVVCPYDRSSAEVCFVVDGNPEEFIRMDSMDIFDWEDVDFSRFSFDSNTSPREVYFKKKKKKYKRLQIGIRNRQPNEGFGLIEIVKCFTVGNYSKNRGI